MYVLIALNGEESLSTWLATISSVLSMSTAIIKYFIDRNDVSKDYIRLKLTLDFRQDLTSTQQKIVKQKDSCCCCCPCIKYKVMLTNQKYIQSVTLMKQRMASKVLLVFTKLTIDNIQAKKQI